MTMMTNEWISKAELDPTLLTAEIDKVWPTGRGWHQPFGQRCGAPTKDGGECQRTLCPGQVRCYRHREPA